jgi:hypothetical protein
MGNKIEGKMLEYSNIQNNFSGGGSNVYRFGHNISDGNFEYQFCSFDVLHPGWHWATEYETGFFNNQYSGSGLNKQNLPIPSYPADCFNGSNFGADCGYWNNTTWVTCPGEETRRFGAGVHRFFYTNHKNGVDKFSAFTLTINYKNSITDIYCPVKSYNVDLSTNNGTTMVPAFAPPTATANGSVITGVQISGPPPGTEVSEGCYLIEYKFLNGDDISYCGFVLSVSSPSTEFTMDTKTTDALLEIDLDDPALLTLPAKVRHSKEFTIAHHRVNDDITGTSRVAWQVQSVGYDQIEAYINEAASLNAELAIVLNIGTGYPQEAVGLLEYLAEKEQQVAHVELGSELMGFWNKGSVKYPDLSTLTATELGELTLPFARALENSPNAFVSATPVATTSTYNFSIDFPGQASNIETKIEDWLRALTSNGKCYVDLINIHNYPTRDTRLLTFDGDKVDKMLAINQALQDQVLIAVGIGIDQAGLPAGSALGYVLTESNTADLAGTEPYRAQHKTMTEGMFYAESFRLAAAAQFEALTPFAFTKPSYWDPPSNIINGDPLDYYSYNVDDVDNNILFYPNNHSLNYDEIYFRPVYRIKKMIAENLRIHVLGQSVANMPIKDNYINGYGTPVPTPQMAILPTMEADESFVHIMVINRKRSGMPNQMSELKVILDGELVKTAEIMAISANSIDEKNPSIYGSANTGLALNHEDPTFQTAIFGALEGIMIPDFSVSILKVAVPQSVACTNILTPINGAVDVPQGANITWAIAPGATGYNVIITNQVGNSTTYSVGLVTSFPLPIQTSCEPVSVTVIPYNAGGPPAEVCPSTTFTMVCCSGCQDLTIAGSGQITWPPVNYSGGSLGTVRIPNGVDLLVPGNQILEFCTSGRLIIEPNAVLTLHGTLTSCNKTWLGVEMPEGLVGHTNDPTYTTLRAGTINSEIDPSFPGTFPTISRAIIGIDYRRGANISCFDTRFTNNYIGARNSPDFYLKHPKAGNPVSFYYVGTVIFKYCVFDITDAYSSQQAFKSHVWLDKADNTAQLRDCQLLNSITVPVMPLKNNYGILATKSSFTSTAGSSGGGVFRGFAVGINTSGVGLSPQGFVLSSTAVNLTFQNCIVGIWDKTSSGNNWNGNRFELGQLPLSFLGYFSSNPNNPLFSTQIGMSAESAVTWSALRDNKFFGPGFGGVPLGGNVVHTIGTNMVNLGSNLNVIYRNEFRGLEFANLATGSNGSLLQNGAPQIQQQGLLYECNTMEDNLNFDVLAQDLTNSVGQVTFVTLKPQQGRLVNVASNIYTAAANCFTDPLTNSSIGQFIFENMSVPPPRINYHNDPNQLCIAVPTEINAQVITVISNATNGCQNYTGIGRESVSYQTLGLNWTPEQTNANRLAYFVAFALRASATSDMSIAYLSEQVHETAKNGFHAACVYDEPLDSILLWLERMETYDALLEKAELEQQFGLNSQALQTLALVIAEFALTEHQLADLEKVPNVWTLRAALDHDNQEAIDALKLIAASEGAYSAALARNALSSADIHYTPILQLNEGVSEREGYKHKSIQKQLLSIMPNPVSDLLFVELLSGVKMDCRFQMFNALGQKVLDIELTPDEPLHTINVSHLPVGIYKLVYLKDGYCTDQQQVSIVRF